MQQLMNLLGKVQLEPGVAVGLLASAGAGLSLDVAAGIARVGSLDNDPAVTNLAARGMNQPGRVIEVGAQAVVVPNAQVSLVWLKTDGSLAVTADAVDPADVAPELGPDPFKGAMLAFDQQEGPLRRRPAASVLLAKVTAAGGAITAVDNRVRSMILI